MNDQPTPLSLNFPTSFGDDPTQVEQIALSCELREIRQPFFNSNTDGSDTQQDQNMVMEMASLLYLGRINDAWHLWRRTLPSTEGKSYRSDPLKEIWTVGAAMLAQDSALAISHLKRLEKSPPPPLSPIIMSNILEKYRERISDNLSKGYSKLNSKSAEERLGFENLMDVTSFLGNRGWRTEGEFSIPPAKTTERRVEFKGVERIGVLTDIVTFMEKERMNA